jgi:hypothetical protein
MKRLLVIVIICTLLILPTARPVAAQSGGSCVVIYVGGEGWRPVTVSLPSWTTQLRLDVEWSGLQLRVWFDGTVVGIGWNGESPVWTYDGLAYAGAHTVEITGILVDYINNWTLYACGSPPPIPTPIPTPTPTPVLIDGPGCESRVGEPAEVVTDSLTIYGPSVGWYVITVEEDRGASGAQGVRWRLTRTGGYITPPPEERTGPASFDVRAGESATITILGATGPGIPMLWVAVSAVCRGMEATPIAPFPDDIKPVEYGVIEEGSDCPMELPRVVFAFSPPMLPLAFNFDFPGVKVCFVYKRLLLGWGNFNIVDWAVPLLVFGFVWSAWLALRRG